LVATMRKLLTILLLILALIPLLDIGRVTGETIGKTAVKLSQTNYEHELDRMEWR
jgi:hypothetical protein